jgi:nitrate/nitrite transporter NarK
VEIVSVILIIVAAIVAVLLIAAIVLFARLWREVKARRRKSKQTSAQAEIKRKIEFTKLILALVMLVYFLTVGLGIHLSLIDPMQFSTLAMLVGAPTATAIGFYAWKAMAENVLKIKKENPKETEGVPFDPGNMM